MFFKALAFAIQKICHLEEKGFGKWFSHFTLLSLYESCNCNLGQLIVRVHGSLARALSGSSICINIWFALPLPPPASPPTPWRYICPRKCKKPAARNLHSSTKLFTFETRHMYIELQICIYNDCSHVSQLLHHNSKSTLHMSRIRSTYMYMKHHITNDEIASILLPQNILQTNLNKEWILLLCALCQPFFQ